MEPATILILAAVVLLCAGPIFWFVYRSRPKVDEEGGAPTDRRPDAGARRDV